MSFITTTRFIIVRNKTALLFLGLILLNNCAPHKGKRAEAANSSVFKTRKGEKTYLASYDKALTLWPIAFEEVDIKTSFGTAHVIISGPKYGPILVLLHGLNASSTMWYPNAEAFSKKYRTYAIDFILEPGKSVLEGEMNGKEAIVKWYNKIFDHFGFKEIYIAGASRGGWISILLALHSDNNRIKKMVLLSPVQTFTLVKPKRKILSNIFYEIHPERKKLRKVLQTMSFNVDNIKQPFIDQYYLASKEGKSDKRVIKMMPFSDDDLKSLNIPVLLLIGDHDIFNKEKSVEKAKSLIPDLESGIIQNAGHFLSIDQPEMVDKRIMDFLISD